MRQLVIIRKLGRPYARGQNESPHTRAVAIRKSRMKIASYKRQLHSQAPLVLDWVSMHKPDVMCPQETKVQDQDFPVDAFRDVGCHATFRGMKGYDGVATLTRQKPERILHGLHKGQDIRPRAWRVEW